MRRGIVGVLLLLPLAAAAQEVYKSVDRQGNVTYSTTPPADAASSAPIAMESGPDAAARAAAEDRLQAQQQYLKQSDEERLARERKRQEERPPAQEFAAPEQTGGSGSAGDSRLVPYAHRPARPGLNPPLDGPGTIDDPAYRPRPEGPRPPILRPVPHAR